MNDPTLIEDLEAAISKARFLDSIEYEALIGRALAALKAREPAGWRPIETAPRDATEIILFGKRRHGYSKEKFIGHWASDLSGSEQPSFEGWFYGTCPGSYYQCYEAPIHWMPLPEPPQSNSAEKKS